MAQYTISVQLPGQPIGGNATLEAESMEDAVSKYRRSMLPRDLEMDERPESWSGVNYIAVYVLYDVYGNRGSVQFFNRDHVFEFSQA